MNFNPVIFKVPRWVKKTFAIIGIVVAVAILLCTLGLVWLGHVFDMSERTEVSDLVSSGGVNKATIYVRDLGALGYGGTVIEINGDEVFWDEYNDDKDGIKMKWVGDDKLIIEYPGSPGDIPLRKPMHKNIKIVYVQK
jgi:hypothetical protein